ncbi:PaaI family thioesterase [Blattabacterium cuenoti]|uniref:PaaI family thioesterase n=1 Tax=Blattabacterium cuenoti TaxID=1653831 RepID=UPI00163BC677|nr:hotdog fold thioesterase [Blattabacterium cuenoti]
MKKKIKEVLNKLNSLRKNTFLNTMKIKFIFISPKIETLIAKMPINKNILQPFGYLHGGASITLAESVGCSLSFINLEKSNYNIFNIEISANHIKCIKKGILFAKAKILHKGKTLHFIHVNVYNEKKIISLCKMTNIILKNKIC